MEILDQIVKYLDTAMSPTVLVVIVGIVDFIFRLVPSKKPIGILHAVAKIARVLSVVLEKLAIVLDKIIPQNIQNQNKLR